MKTAKKLALIKTSLYIIISLLFTLLIRPIFGSAMQDEASMRIIIDKGSFFDPEYLDIEIVMEAPVDSYNAVMGLISYDPAYLRLDETRIDDSFCKLVVGDLPNTEAGKKAIICGNPDNNASSTMPLAQLRFKKQQAGLTKLSLADSRMLSGDGLARDLLSDNETHYVELVKQR